MNLRPSILFWKVFIGTSLLIALVLGTCTWLIIGQVDRFYGDELTQYLKAQAIAIRHMVRTDFDQAHAAELDRFTKAVGADKENRVRITMILNDGVVLADSEANPSEMESHAHRREVLQALAEGWGEDARYSRTVSREMKYVAVRLGPKESPRGVVRVSMALQTIGQRSEAVQQFIWTTTLLGLGAAILFAMGLAVLWSNPLRRITAMARSLSQGDLSTRVSVSGNDEMALLARSLNEMRMHLTGQLETIDRQRRTLQSLLAQLREGVVVADPQGKILLINPTAAQLLDVSPEGDEGLGELVGRPVEQCVTDHEIQKMLLSPSEKNNLGPAERNATVVNPTTIQEAQIRLNDAKRGEMILLAQASNIVLPNFDPGHQIRGTGKEPSVGRMVVLTNITELTRTIQVKSDFASNASHELRTPLSAIRAAVETMEELDFAKDSESAKRFLAMIDRHSRRMEEMVSDLLDLTRLESSSTRFKWHRLNLPDLLKEVHQRYQDRLDKGKLNWVTRVEPGLMMIDGNPYLLHLILGNLLDNAIKFTEAGGSVSVSCQQPWEDGTRNGAVAFTMTDTGCGIPAEEQARVFERFYQVEPARSGTRGAPAEARGTGLGLSIVKHAVTALGGDIELKSTPGQGTRITVSIPQSSEEELDSSHTL